MTDNHERTNDYLEYLAGRKKSPPEFPSDDRDILRGVTVLKSLKKAEAHPQFFSTLKKHVTAPGRGSRPLINFHQPALTWHRALRLGGPALAVVTIAVVLTVTPKTFWTTLWSTWRPSPPVAQAATVTFTPVKGDTLGVEADTAFVIAAKSGTLAQADVEKNLRFEPAVDFSVRASGTNSFTVTPKKSLDNSIVYAAKYTGLAKATDGNLTPQTYSWAYQVRRDFRVTGTLPREATTGIGVDTGIEVTFSNAGVTAQEFGKHWRLEPSVDGRFEVHNRTVAFIPEKKLKERTLYTATVTAGLTPAGADAGLPEDVTFRFETGATGNYLAPFSLTKTFEVIRPNDPLVLNTSFFNNDSSAPKASTYRFTVYQYPSLDDFTAAVTNYRARIPAWSLYASAAAAFPTSGLKKAGTFSVETKADAVFIGQGFAEGSYVAISADAKLPIAIPFQVSNIGSYVMTTETETLVWVNNMGTGKPIAQATVTVDATNVSAKTNAEGIATFPTPDRLAKTSNDLALGRIAVGHKQTTAIFRDVSPYFAYNSWDGWRNESTTLCWSYLSVDRQIYKPNDTVNFWGLAKRREKPQPSETVHLEIVHDSYDRGERRTVLASTDVTTSPTGTYLGHLDLAGVPTGWGTMLVASLDGTVIDTKYLDVQTFQTPAYQITVTPERYAAILGDTMNYRVATTFFDGTPVPHLSLVSSDDRNTITTDGRGQATISRKITSPYSDGLSLSPSDATNGDVFGSVYVQSYPAAVTIEAAGRVQGASGVVSGTVRRVHPERANPQDQDPLAKVIGEPIPDQEVRGTLVAYVTTETQEGTTYDFLSKKVIPLTRFDTREEVRETFTATTDAKGKFTTTLTIDPNISYRVDLAADDAKQRTMTTAVSLVPPGIYSGYYGGGYQLVDAAATRDSRSATYSVGETVKLAVTNGPKSPATTADTRFLFLVNQRGLRRHTVQTDPQYSFLFTDADVPNVDTRAILFTGRGFEELTGPTVFFDQRDRELQITVTPDKKTYQPGQQATVRVAVVNSKKQPVRARVNLKAVDEAVIALQGGEGADPLSQIYRWVDNGVISSYISHEEVKRAQMAEGGGGGGDRTNFKDTAAFTEVTTDADGRGEASFTVPDNLTSWRVTAQAVTDTLDAGVTSTLLPVQKSMFIVPVFSDRLLERDRATVAVTAYGSAVAKTDPAAFTVTIDDQPAISAVGNAFQQTMISLPALSVGDHRVRVAGTVKTMSDAVVKTIHVASSYLTAPVAKEALLDNNQAVALAPEGRTNIRLADADRNLAYQTFWELIGAPHQRLDETAASNLARTQLTTVFKETVPGQPGDIDGFSTGKGYAQYVTGSEDIAAGATAAAGFDDAAQELANRWFTTVVDGPKSNTEEVALALYGLAQSRQPVLPEVHALLALPDLPDADRLVGALALEALGDVERARGIAQQLLTAYRATQGQYVYLTLGAQVDEKIVNTGRFAILAAGLGLDDRYALLRYLCDNPPPDTTTHMEQALAASRLLANATTGSVSVTYTVNGQSTTKTLSGSEAATVSLSAAEAKTFAVTAHTGNVSAISTYAAPFDPAAATDPRLTITRTYTVNGKPATTFRRGDIVKIQFAWEKKAGELGKFFAVTDLLPSIFRVVSNPWRYANPDNSFNYPYALENNRVKLYAWESSFYYYALAAQDGTAVAEPPMIQALDVPANIQYGAEATVTVKE